MNDIPTVSNKLTFSVVLVLIILLAGCNAHSGPGLTAGLFAGHSDAPRWKVFGIALTATPEETKQLILKEWPNAVISNQPEDFTISGGSQISGAPRLVARPAPGTAGSREEVMVQFDLHNHIVSISHGKSFPLPNAPMSKEFLHAFSKQYAPGIDNGYANLTYYSGPDGKIHQAYPDPGGVADFSYAGSARLVAFPNPTTGEIDLAPHLISIDPADKRSDHEVVTIESYSFSGPEPQKLYGYGVELESEPVWSGWLAEQEVRRKAAASHLGDSLKGTKF